jgi:periplasmic protein TonB
MPRHLHFTISLALSLALHALVLALALFLVKPAPEIPVFTPVRIVNLPPQEAVKLPPVRRSTPVPPPPARPTPPPPVPRSVVPEKPLPPEAVPVPKKFGEGEDLKLPKTQPPLGVPGGAEQGSATGKTGPAFGLGPAEKHRQTGPLPFTSWNDIDELARKGMPAGKPGDESVTLDTNEFKFISYNRWLKIKIESVLTYPELAAREGYQGTLYVRFDILRNGSLGDVEVLQGSGFPILDNAAVRAIRSAAPFQPLPDDWGMERYSIRAAVIFYMNSMYVR